MTLLLREILPFVDDKGYLPNTPQMGNVLWALRVMSENDYARLSNYCIDLQYAAQHQDTPQIEPAKEEPVVHHIQVTPVRWRKPKIHIYPIEEARNDTDSIGHSGDCGNEHVDDDGIHRRHHVAG